MYPLKFTKVTKEKVWGGRQFSSILNMEIPEGNIGESWEICSHKNGMSVVKNGIYRGMTLKSLIEKDGEELLGKKIVRKFNKRFPLLIKYLDINDKLSVQVHPNDEFALREEGEFGKYESWFIVEASEDATIIMGIKDGITQEQLRCSVYSQDFSDLFREVKVKKSDIIDIKPGLVHASSKGSILVCEIQQNSDTTYRIFDFNRVVDGKKRELHIEKSLKVIDYSLQPKIISDEQREKKEIKNGFIEALSSNDYYNINRIKINNGIYSPDSYENFKIQSIIGGKGFITYDEDSLAIAKGDTILIPANKAITISGYIEFLESYI